MDGVAARVRVDFGEVVGAWDIPYQMPSVCERSRGACCLLWARGQAVLSSASCNPPRLSLSCL